MPRMVTLFMMILVLLKCSKLVAAEGRGKVGDKDLIAAHQACMRAKARARDAATRTKVGVATTILVDEYRRRAGLTSFALNWYWAVARELGWIV